MPKIIGAENLEVLQDNTEEFTEAMRAQILKGLETVGLLAEGHAKQICPVDTGRLRNSITHVVDPGEPAAYIGTNVEYAPYVELGTSKQAAQPYLRPAATNHTSQYQAAMRSALGK